MTPLEEKESGQLSVTLPRWLWATVGGLLALLLSLVGFLLIMIWQSQDNRIAAQDNKLAVQELDIRKLDLRLTAMESSRFTKDDGQRLEIQQREMKVQLDSIRTLLERQQR